MSLEYRAVILDGSGKVVDPKEINSEVYSRAVRRGAKEMGLSRPYLRERLPTTRDSITHKFDVAGHEGYITVGLYEDKKPGELFITMAKEGSTVGGLMDAFGTAVSLLLQSGTPLKDLVYKFSNAQYEPRGFTKNPAIPESQSITDYIFSWLGYTFLSEQEQKDSGIGEKIKKGGLETIADGN